MQNQANIVFYCYSLFSYLPYLFFFLPFVSMWHCGGFVFLFFYVGLQYNYHQDIEVDVIYAWCALNSFWSWFSSSFSLQLLIGTVCHNTVLEVFNVGKLCSLSAYCMLKNSLISECFQKRTVCWPYNNMSHTGYLAC